MRILVACILLSLVLSGHDSEAEICLSSLAQIDSNPESAKMFSSFVSLFDSRGRIGILNETKGTFVQIEARSGEMIATLYSSTFFDLYAVRKESKILVCAEQQKDGKEGRMSIEAFGRKENLKIEGAHILVGSGGPKYTFDVGVITPQLAKVHQLNTVGKNGEPTAVQSGEQELAQDVDGIQKISEKIPK
jgi:hypothetical protein